VAVVALAEEPLQWAEAVAPVELSQDWGKLADLEQPVAERVSVGQEQLEGEAVDLVEEIALVEQ
jgi:hypothetical protein